jgi:S-adenosylmethionine synthetase
MGVFVTTNGTSKVSLSDGEIAQKVMQIFNLTPYGIETQLKLRNPIYAETAAYGHMGRKNEVVTKTFEGTNGETKTVEVELFTWEKLDFVDKIKEAFNIA